MIRKNNGYKNKVQNSISEESRLINISSSPYNLEFYLKENKNDIFSSIFNYTEKIKSSIIKFKYLKQYIGGILLIYFLFSFNIHFWSVEYKEEVFTVGKERTYLKKNLINNYNSFINNCTSGILSDNNSLTLSENPKISVTIPIYNAEKYLYYSLRSIQNQKMKDIEIILIDDYSKDNSIST